ncbi:MAG: thioredoxin [Alphaproteobacteria bacterium]
MDDLIGYKDGAVPEDLIKDADMASFMDDVVEASKITPVLVDFWAEWCQPCKTLTPLLEKVVIEARGAIKLVKVDADKNQELAQQLRIQSLPTVMAFKDGQPVDSFTGALPESEIKNFIARFAADGEDPNLQDYINKGNELLTEGKHEEALALFSQILQADAENLDAIAGLAQGFLKMGQDDKAREVLKTLTEDRKAHPAIATVLAALEFSEGRPGEDKLIKLKEAVEKKPEDNQAAYDLAEGLFAGGQKEEAADALLAIIAREREWNEEAARKLLLRMFEAAGPSDPFTLETRRKLSSVLFS